MTTSLGRRRSFFQELILLISHSIGRPGQRRWVSSIFIAGLAATMLLESSLQRERLGTTANAGQTPKELDSSIEKLLQAMKSNQSGGKVLKIEPRE
jgi:hypothetical protein